MSCFTSQVDGMSVFEPDPTKHVKYNLGMVLGVDDFTQEFAYLSGRDQWLARDLIGYGTARGLQVTVENDVKGWRVMVAPGVAVSPKGQMICVPSAQCAYLNEWLSANTKELARDLQSPLRSELKVYVVLCYRDCPTDKVPIPGEPCRSEEDLTAPSRLTDDFQLELRLKAPNQREEDALRDFTAWLRLIEISDSVVSPVSLEQFEGAIREAAKPWLSPLTSPISSPLGSPPSDFMFGSPPAFLQIPASEAFDYMRAAFRIWTTELRPRWIGRWQGCAPDKPGGMSLAEENCVLLAALNIPVLPISPGGFAVDDSPIDTIGIDESRRPFLVHLRMLQQWLLGRESQAFPSDDVVEETEFGRVQSAGVSVAFSRADHTHGTPALPNLEGDVEGEIIDVMVKGIQGVPVAATEPEAGQVLTFVKGADVKKGEWAPADIPAPTLIGDVTGAADVTVVERIRGVEVDETPPEDGQALIFSKEKWRPGNPPSGGGTVNAGGDVVGPLDANRITNIQDVPMSLPTGRALADADGKVLTLRSSELRLEDVPQPTVTSDVVEHPNGLGRYLMVAAGTIRGDNRNEVPSYNELIVRRVATSQMTVTFNGYRQPDQTFQYVVKVLPITNESVQMPIVTLDKFLTRDLGFALRILNGEKEVSAEILESFELMVEVSQYFVKG